MNAPASPPEPLGGGRAGPAGGILAALLLSIAAPTPASDLPAETNAYVASLIARADRLQLAESRRWHLLLHYQRNRLGAGVTSLAGGSDFFVAADGRTDPHAELAATLAALFDPSARARNGEHPSCVFKARYRWLSEALDLDQARLPKRPCERFDAWMAGLRPQGLTLVFPEAYMNNPASMFGHTLLRVDMGDSEGDHDLLAYAINFAAETGADGGAAFALKGVFGLYDGFFSVMPYYDKIKQYGDWENRDIWEYGLELTRAEVELVLMHLWELRGVPFTYYFFDDNCSYQLLSLLEVARPELRLTDEFPAWVIPVDTVRVITEHPELVGAVELRPAPATLLRRQAGALPRSLQRSARKIADGTLAPEDGSLTELAPDSRAATLALAYDYLHYRYLAGEVSREESAPRARRILVARSRVEDDGGSAASPSAAAAARPATRPDHGHPAPRASVGAGWLGDRAIYELRLRPQFHDLMDPGAGYTAGAQITLLETALRYDPRRESVRLHELVLVDVTSISPRSLLLRPISWKIGTGVVTRPLRDGAAGDLEPEAVWRSSGGGGLAYEVAAAALAYGFAEATVDVAGSLEDDAAAGVGTTLGIYLGSEESPWRTHLFARVTEFALGDTTTSARLGYQQRVDLGRRTAVVLDVGWERAFGEDWLESKLSWQVYFGRGGTSP